MRSLILGTAGHIDHGKTELVRALTGVDTDRLKEEKERGITIDLGFAELPGAEVHIGVVDVPGHEGFVRNMLAGATGMDVVVLVVAADEGVMPQTREHLAIVELLGVERLVVALTKSDLVEPEWIELVRDEVRETLATTPYANAAMVVTSARTGQGIDVLRERLLEVGAGIDEGDPADLAFLPLDRAFTVRGTGTVVTGTLWSGRLRAGARVRLLPDGHEGRVRGLQVHGSDIDEAHAGERTAVALAGDAMDLDHVRRGQALVTEPDWPASRMLTVRFRLLPDTDWELAHNQRVRVHLGTAEVMARCVLFTDMPLRAGLTAWGQLRLEEPVAARARQRIVLRSYSPVTTIGGARVAEPFPPKRRRGASSASAHLGAVLDGEPEAAVEAVAVLAGWAGTPVARLAVDTGLAPAALEPTLPALEQRGALRTARGFLVAAETGTAARDAVVERVERLHREAPYRPGIPLEELRECLPRSAAEGLVDAALGRLVAEGMLESFEGGVRRAGFQPNLDARQEALAQNLAETYRAAGLTPPHLADLPAASRDDPAFWTIVRRLEEEGRVVALEDGLFVWREALDDASERVRTELAGHEELGPADFKRVVQVSRRYLLPILAHFDREGVTVRSGDRRAVPARAAPERARE
jgi:selenocysteine-specific elongation factor